jgi:hypothetical protein
MVFGSASRVSNAPAVDKDFIKSMKHVKSQSTSEMDRVNFYHPSCSSACLLFCRTDDLTGLTRVRVQQEKFLEQAQRMNEKSMKAASVTKDALGQLMRRVA